MIEIYANLVKNGIKTIDEVPETIRIAVKEALGQEITDDERLSMVAAQKLSEMSATCGQMICKGIDIELSTGTYHFSLTNDDQTNIDGIFNAVVLGASEYPYHADGEPCTVFSANDIMKLYISVKSFVTQQTTYNNMLRQWIKRENNIETVKSITYGITLPNDLNSQMTEILSSANEQIQSIIAKLKN